VGGLVALLQYFAVGPKDLTMAFTHNMWLMLATVLVSCSVGMAAYSAYSTFWRGNPRNTHGRQACDDAVKISLLDLVPECFPFDSQLGYKSKVRAVFRNEQSEAMIISGAQWSAGAIGLPAQEPFVPATLQLEGPNGWEANDWPGKESETLRILPGRAFRLWIGLNLDIGIDPGVRDAEIRRRGVAKRLGTLELTLRISGAAEQLAVRI